MADQSIVRPIGVVPGVPVKIQGTIFNLDFVVLRLPQVEGSFPLLIGRPWLRHANVLHDWGKDTMWVKQEGKELQQIILEEGLDNQRNTSMMQTIGICMEEEVVDNQEADLFEGADLYEDENIFAWLHAEDPSSCYGIFPNSSREEAYEEKGEITQVETVSVKGHGKEKKSKVLLKRSRDEDASNHMSMATVLWILVWISIVMSSLMIANAGLYKNVEGAPASLWKHRVPLDEEAGIIKINFCRLIHKVAGGDNILMEDLGYPYQMTNVPIEKTKSMKCSKIGDYEGVSRSQPYRAQGLSSTKVKISGLPGTYKICQGCT
ncbi:hypothetical protein KP509_31G072900 [Ceratopteris richardii]|uniref:Uncharacterized protein n=1 Tax=Ceratopteris richardii TaxID=49495 RepID=A0A8T2R103_CERRI|nr:hypothetical protein KP509_31G072900 [Ceratopteris richardii]